MLGKNEDIIINILKAKGVIIRTPHRGHYHVVDCGEQVFTRRGILARFTTEVAPSRFEIINSEVYNALHGRPVVLRTIQRQGYHSGTRNYAPYIAAITPDEDGVKRTYGLEYEIYSLSAEQEDKLARLLDTLPAHVAEHDGSLGSRGIEIVFMPMGERAYIDTVKKLRHFVDENNVAMGYSNGDGAGMHTTYGVSNYESAKIDLQIRLNRFALAIAALATKPKILEVFGRTFGTYRTLPRTTTEINHANAFSTNGRPESCWECRLPNYKADPEKLVKFFKISESVFHRAFNAEDFQKLYEFLDVVTE